MNMRETMLHNAVNAVRAENGLLNVASIAKHLPPDFDLQDDAEFAAAVAATNPASEAYDAKAAEPEAAEVAAEPVEPVAEPMPTHELPTIQEAEQHVIDCRVMLRQLSDDLRVKRGKLADAITRWQTNGAPMTHSELIRDFLKSEQAARVRRAQQGYGEQSSAPVPSGSHLDRLAAGSRGGTPDRGYSSSYRRGGRPVSQYGTRVAKPGAV